MDLLDLLCIAVPIALVLIIGHLHRQEGRSLRRTMEHLREIERQRRHSRPR